MPMLTTRTTAQRPTQGLARRQAHPSTMTVLIAPSGFKESLSAEGAADHIAAGVLRALPHARVLKAPMAARVSRRRWCTPPTARCRPCR